jgi:hypothetical protein
MKNGILIPGDGDSVMDELEEKKKLLAETDSRLYDLQSQRTDLLAQIAKIEGNNATTSIEQESLISSKNPVTINNLSPQEVKIRLFRSLFRGREDVFARRFESRKTGKKGYQPVCRNEWVAGRCDKPRIRCEVCSQRDLLSITDDVIEYHLKGNDPNEKYLREYTIGIYPILLDESCWFLAVNFDKTNWRDDTRAFLETCDENSIPVALERSRSGNGGHIWLFFSEPIPAWFARKLGSILLSTTMDHRPEIGLDSYDRIFPN